MQEKQIIDEIIRYLQDENYRYAVMIDGNWGCGKTHFVLHDLKIAIEEYEEKNSKRNIKYISLYGCNSIEEIEKNIYWSIIDKTFFDLQDRLKKAIPIEPVYGRVAEKRKKQQRILMTATKKIIGTAMQKFDIAGKDFEVVSEIVTLDKNIFIFDDLERCNCSINDILGYINGLVEHEGVKTILIANESEIGQLRRKECGELQALVAAQSNILVPEEPAFWQKKEKKDPLKEFSLDELERRRNKIFSEEEWDDQYKKIREKLIGITIHYNPDVSTILHHLIDEFKGNYALRKCLENHVQFFINIMNQNQHFNFRTFQFFLSKIEYIYLKVNQIDIKERYKQKVLDFIVMNCFEICVEYKANTAVTINPTEKIFYDKKLRLQSIKTYVKTSTLEIGSLSGEVDQYIKEELFEKLAIDDPLNQLHNRWYLEPQVWVEEKIVEILEKLEKRDYHENAYRGILLILMRLEIIGFSEKNLKKAVAYIKDDLSNKGKTLSEEWYMIEDEKFADKYKTLIKDINQELMGMKSPAEDIEKILENDKEWGKLLIDYIEKNEFQRQWKSGFLRGIDAQKWVRQIKESNPENLFLFRKFLQVALPSNVVREGIKEDMPTVNKILEGLGDGSDEKDLIKRQEIKWIIKDLKEANQRFTDIYAKDYANI